jgi:hypothetical protein
VNPVERVAVARVQVAAAPQNRLSKTYESPPHRVTMMWSRLWARVVPVGFMGAHTDGRGCFQTGVLDQASSPLISPNWSHIGMVGGSTQFGRVCAGTS